MRVTMENDNWRIWDRRKDYGELLYSRATGQSEEMESSKAVCELLSKVYKPGMKLVDVGCGAGHYLRSLRERLDQDIDYTGIDATKHYIDLAKKAFPTQANFHLGDIYDIPLEDNSFDIVMSNNVILHLPPPPVAALRELIRVSKRYVVVRTVFSKRNYIIKEIREDEELDNKSDKKLTFQENIFNNFNYFNMYTEKYIISAIKSIDKSLKLEIIDDLSWEKFDNTRMATNTATKVIDKAQISGNLLLKWKFIVLTKI